MPRNATRLQLRTRARQRADMVADDFVTDAEVNDLIDVYLCELYDMLVEASPPDYYSAETTITTAAGTIAYALPADFRSLVQVYSLEAADHFRPLDTLTDIDRNVYRSPQGAYSVRVRYIPAPPTLTTDSGSTGQFDGISGWEHLVVCWVARSMLSKDRRDTSQLDAEIQHLIARVRSQAPKHHAGMPRRVQDVESIGCWPYPYGSSVDAYQLRRTASTAYLDLYTLTPSYP